MLEHTKQQKYKHAERDSGPISWWSWRPGMQPRNALVLGSLLSVVALLLAGLGLITLIVGIVDSVAPPLQVTGIVTGQTTHSLNGLTRLTVRVHTPGFPNEVFPLITPSAMPTFAEGTSIWLDYSPHFRMLYALESEGRRYTLPNAGTKDVFVGSVTLLLIGGLLLPYPLVLTGWGWRDLYGYKKSKNYCEMTARVLGLRVAAQTRAGRVGLVPCPTRSWYGVALCPIAAAGVEDQKQVMTFALAKERYVSLHEGDAVLVKYSPHVHYVYSLEQLSEYT
ncbi:MAG: hypothetical protein NVS4B7_15580 [Ktedonobacteraceae bacterium]